MAKKTETKKDQKAESMTQFIDSLLVKGGTLEELTQKTKAEQDKRGGSRYKNSASILAHMQHRASRKKDPMQFNVKLDKIEEDTFVKAE